MAETNSNVSGNSNYRGHGTLKSMSAVIKNVNNSKSLDVSSIIIDVAIYEDIFAKTMYGVVAIKDGINLMNGMTKDKTGGTVPFPIVGEEYIEFTYEVIGFKPITRRFAINAIKQIKINESLTTRDYVIEFCSEEHLIDSTLLVQKSYQDQISNMVEDVLKKYLKVDQEITGGKRKKTYDIQPTKGKQNLVIPRLSPLETMDFLARRSIAETVFQSASYLFFENSDGFNFCDIEYLIRRGKKKFKTDTKQYTYYYENPRISKPLGGVQDDTKTFKTIIGMTQKHKFDTIEKLRNGYFENQLFSYDFNAKKLNEKTFKFIDQYPNLNTLGAGGTIAESSYPENSIDFIRSVTGSTEGGDKNVAAAATKGAAAGAAVGGVAGAVVGAAVLGIFELMKDAPQSKATKIFLIPKDSTQPDTFLEDVYTNRASYMTRFAQNMFSADVYGDPNITVGDVISIELPEIIGTTGNKAQYDTFLSGYFMVSGIHHKLTSETYYATFDLFKNGFSEPVISTDSGERPEPSNSAYLNNAAELGVKK